MTPDVSKIFGKIQIVEDWPDYKVQVVDNWPDLKVQKVDQWPDSIGKWQIVEDWPDFKIEFVDHWPQGKQIIPSSCKNDQIGRYNVVLMFFFLFAVIDVGLFFHQAFWFLFHSLTSHPSCSALSLISAGKSSNFSLFTSRTFPATGHETFLTSVTLFTSPMTSFSFTISPTYVKSNQFRQKQTLTDNSTRTMSPSCFWA